MIYDITKPESVSNPHRLDVYVNDKKVRGSFYVDTERGIIRKNKPHPDTGDWYAERVDGCDRVAVEEITVDPASIRVEISDLGALYARLRKASG